MKTQKTTTGIFLLIVWSILLLIIPAGDATSQHHSGGVFDNGLYIKPLLKTVDFSFQKEGGLPELPTVQLNVKGSDALIHDITIGTGGSGLPENTAIGFLALYYNTNGSKSENNQGKYNTAIGAGAMHKNELGNLNTSVGALALYTNVGGYFNTAVGYGALYDGENNKCNTATGYGALHNNQTGDFNTANGVHALVHNNTGSGNTAVGFNAMEANTTGSSNTAVGYRTLELNAAGENNTAVGFEAGKQSDSGASINESTFVGADAYPSSNDLFNVTGIGYGARPTQSNQVWLGNIAAESFYCAPLTAPSDEKYKSNVEEKVAGLDFILGLRPVTFNLDVHEMAAYLGEYIRYDKDGNLRYAEFVVPIVKAIQEQQQQIETLTPEGMDELLGKVDALEAHNASLTTEQKALQEANELLITEQKALQQAHELVITEQENLKETNQSLIIEQEVLRAENETARILDV